MNIVRNQEGNMGSAKMYSHIIMFITNLGFPKSNEYIYTRQDFHCWNSKRGDDDFERRVEDDLTVYLLLNIQSEKARGIRRRVETPPSSDDVAVTTN